MKKDMAKLTLFDYIETKPKKLIDGKKYNTQRIIISNAVKERLNYYKLEDYIEDVENLGLEKTWDYICQYAIDSKGYLPDFLNIRNFGELYEIGLAIEDKILKKKSGQYYTPDDVALVMSKWLYKCEGTAVCDVACGTGKLILTYLELIGYEKARELISSGNLYLYDFDNVALKICKTTISIIYGLDIAYSIHDIFCDFLDNSLVLPDDCKVISNPPYAKVDEIQSYWNHTDVVLETKEYYSSFMEKIFSQSRSAVIITPFSFISGSKFYSLRRKMSLLGNGFIVSFDNVPGNIFNGRKHGIFNTNTANSVRAAITLFNSGGLKKGYKISPLIRFKNEERNVLLNCETLEKMLPDVLQVVDENNQQFEKVSKELIEIFYNWRAKSKYKIKDFLSKKETNLLIDMPNTCRYFTTASCRKLSRTGSITMYFTDKDVYNFIYCIINSSFTYWWWRVYDGGITYPVSLLNNMPLPYNLLSLEDKEFFNEMFNKLQIEEENYIVKKVNAGIAQENIKFPEEYRKSINKRILKILGFDVDESLFDQVHANRFLR